MVDPITGAQPIYDMVINVRVTDSNVLAEGDRTAENKEAPLVFEVVPIDILYAYIAREEAELGRKLDDVINRVETAQKNLQASASRAPLLSPETSTSEQTRMETILEGIGKSRELVGEIATDYSRILAEYKANRFEEKLSSGLETNIINPLKEVQGKEFGVAEDALNKFYGDLKSGDSKLAVVTASPAVVSVDQLLNKLKEIRGAMGKSIELTKLIVKLQAQIKDQEKIQQSIDEIQQGIYNDIFNIGIKPASDIVNVAVGQTVKVSLKIRMPETIIADPSLRFEVSTNSGLKIKPSEIKLKEDASTAEFEIVAGTATGTYSVRIIPSQGKPIDLKVNVK